MNRNLKNDLGRLGILAVYLFGSMFTGKTSPASDIDLGIVFKDNFMPEHTKDMYIKLYKIFSEVYPSFIIDIVFLQSAPLTLQYDAIRNGKVLFQAEPALRADYEAKVISMYLDFKPVLKVFDDAASIRRANV